MRSDEPPNSGDEGSCVGGVRQDLSGMGHCEMGDGGAPVPKSTSVSL